MMNHLNGWRGAAVVGALGALALAGCSSARADHPAAAGSASAGVTAAEQAINQAKANPAYAHVVTVVTPCLQGNNPNTSSGQAALLVIVIKQRHAIEAHKSGTIVDCAETKLQMTTGQKSAFESDLAPLFIADLKLPDHKAASFVYVSLPAAYLKATNQSAATSVAHPSGSASSTSTPRASATS
jgi:hypothetical protein